MKTRSTRKSADKDASVRLWQKSPTPNLIRYSPSGTYYARVKVRGKLIRQSLGTDVYSVAVLRLGDFVQRERARVEGAKSVEAGRMTVGEVLDLYLSRVDADPKLKPGSKAYRQRCVAALKTTWPDLPRLDARKVTASQCDDWARRFACQYHATFFNNTVGTLRHVLDIAVKAGARFGNPANEIRKEPVRPERLALPSQEQFQRLVEFVETRGGRFSRDCADLIRFLAFGGFRRGEAKHITWADCDLEHGAIVVRGDPETGTRNHEIRRVPIISDMKGLLERLRSERGPVPSSQPVMRINECQKAIDRAAKELGFPRFTHHDLRHLFATRCIESGVDISTVSRWLGHKDGGALAMRVYGHLRDQHSEEMALRVSFYSLGA